MKIIKENINFIQGDNPYKSLSIGLYAPIKIGDIYILGETIYNIDPGQIKWKIANKEFDERVLPLHSIIMWKNTILKVIDIWPHPFDQDQNRIVFGKIDSTEQICVTHLKFIKENKNIFLKHQIKT